MRVIVLGSGTDPDLLRLAALLQAVELEVQHEEADRPGALDYVLTESRAHGLVFDADALTHDAFRRLRQRHAGPTWIAWMRGYSSSRVARLLRDGADEAVNTSMGDDELKARILTTLSWRRGDTIATLTAGALEIDLPAGQTTWAGEEIDLTRREREVLAILAASPGRPVRREVVYREVWGFSMARGDRTVDVNVKRLRSKLAAAGAGVEIKTRPGVGYSLEVIVEPIEEVVTEL